jgi:Tol biopolymer transport system component
MVAATGVIWTRLTPTQVVEPDRADWFQDSLVFQVQDLGEDRIAVAREDGSGIQIQPETKGVGARAPRWVRPGLTVESSDRSGSEDLWYREIATGATRRLTDFLGSEWTPAPRPGTPGIVYVEGGDPLGGRLALIPDTAQVPLQKIYLTPFVLLAGEPSFDSTGNQVCFSAAGPNGTRQIWKVSFSDTLAVQLTVAGTSNPPSGPVLDRSPRWSPDGTRILMASNRGGRWGVWLLSPMGEAQGLTVVAQDLPSAEIRHPAWSPDGTEIVISSDRTGERALWRLSNLGL